MPSVSVRNHLHLHLIVFIWGFTAVLGALITVDALQLVWFRMVLSSVFIALFIWYCRLTWTVKFSELLVLMGAGVVLAVHWITFFWAIKVSNVSVSLAMLSTGAFFAALLEPIFYRRKVILYEIILGCLVVVALFLIFRFETDYTLGIILALISAFLSACLALINGKLTYRHSAAVISFYEMVGGVLTATIFLMAKKQIDMEFFQIPLADWFWLFILALICTAYAFIASVSVMRYLSPYTVMLTINLEPIYGILLAFWVFGDSEHMSPEFYFGASLILLTVLINVLLKTKSRARMKADF